MIFFFFKKQVLVRMWGERGHLCSISGFVNYNSHYGKPHGGSSETCCSVSCVRLSATPWTAALQASLSIAVSRSLLKLMSIESVMPSPK